MNKQHQFLICVGKINQIGSEASPRPLFLFGQQRTLSSRRLIDIFIYNSNTLYQLKIHNNIIKKMPTLPPNQRTAYGTYLHFAESGTLETFMRDYRRILMDNFQKAESKVAGNIRPAVRIMIPGMGSGNPGRISSGCVVSGVSMILQ